MIAANALSLIRMLLVMTLGVCSMLWVDYSSELSMYCGAAADCQIVRLSPFAYPLGVPLPAVALVGLLAILVLSFPKTTTFRAMFVIALALIGVGSLTLLALQAFVIKAFCPLCVTVDITLALTAVLGWRYRRKLKPRWFKMWAWILLALAAIAAPIWWSRTQPPPPLPPAVASLYDDGKVNVVLFADFMCPHCKALHPRLLGALDSIAGDKKNLISFFHTRHSPTDRVDLSASYVCAEAQQKGEPMAELLFAEQGRFGDAHTLAAKLNLSIGRFETCLQDPATQALLQRNEHMMHEAGIEAFPTLFIGDARMVGDVSTDRLEKATRSAIKGQSSSVEVQRSQWLILGLFLVVVAVCMSGRIASGGRKRTSTHID